MKLSRVGTAAVTTAILAFGFMGCGDTEIIFKGPGQSADQGSKSARTGASAPVTAVQTPQPNPAPTAQIPVDSTFSESCGYGISVNSVTSCPFALNVHEAWAGGGPGVYTVWSPGMNRFYDMSCDVGDVSVICSEVNATDGSNDAAVMFPPYG